MKVKVFGNIKRQKLSFNNLRLKFENYCTSKRFWKHCNKNDHETIHDLCFENIAKVKVVFGKITAEIVTTQFKIEILKSIAKVKVFANITAKMITWG